MKLSVVRIRQLLDDVRHRLSFVPMVYVVASIALVQLLLWIDKQLGDDTLPLWFETTVESARSVFSAMAGGLITSITLLLSMMLVAVQLASSQFSPRTLRDWLGNRTVQHAVGLVLGTTVFCLLALRSTRDFGEDSTAIVPNLTVLVAVAMGVLSLVAVVRTVDHITHSLQVGAVSRRIADETIQITAENRSLPTGQVAEVAPAAADADDTHDLSVPPGAAVIEAPAAGWIQQIDQSTIFGALPEHSTCYVVGSIGTYVQVHSPLLWVSPAPPPDDACRASLLQAFALGDSRTMQQDVEFGIVQLTDVAVRALSPGVNDPSTASDVIVHLGSVLLAIWERPRAPGTDRRDGRTIVRHHPSHEEYLRRAIGPIRRYGAADVEVMSTLVRMVQSLRSEVIRRGLPGPVGPLDGCLAELRVAADRAAWSPGETALFDELCERPD